MLEVAGTLSCAFWLQRISLLRWLMLTMSKTGIERVSFLPAFINPIAQPYPLKADDPKFKEVLEFTEWVSDQHPHKFRVDGNEVVVDTKV
jgi:poly-gamma-glutamate synthesis protein (capsule biosynthesis protein)